VQWDVLVPVLGMWLCAVAIVAAVFTLPSLFPSAFSASASGPPPPPLCAPDCTYVRIMADGETCASSGHSDVTSLAECEAAFAEQEHAGKRSSSVNLAASAQNFSFVPKGCHSSCFSDYSGYFCRAFNSHAGGSGERTSSVDDNPDNQLYVLCRAKVKFTGLAQTLGRL
jgi:hypothetical protein